MRKMTKLIAVLVLAVFCVTALAAAAADSAVGTPLEYEGQTFTEWKDSLLGVRRITFTRHKDGIGLGDCPVYTAPYKDALRLANNRQAADTNVDIWDGGTTDEGWLLVRYDVAENTTRVGYIPAKYLGEFKSNLSAKKLGRIPAVAADVIEVTDDPIRPNGRVFATLRAGQEFEVLAKYTYNGNWWYIELEVDGKRARGFIDREHSCFRPGDGVQNAAEQPAVNLEALGTPSISPLNTQQAGEILILGDEKDSRKNVHRDASLNSDRVTVVYPTRTYPCYDVQDAGGRSWYYIFIEEDSIWGWVASELAAYLK